eukprot:gene6362-10368_t
MPGSDSPKIQRLCKKATDFFLLNKEKTNNGDEKAKHLLKEKFDDLLDELKEMKLGDVGIDDIEPYQSHHIFIPIFESELFVISVFVLPKDSTGLPLHNHPNMTILSKFLYGKALITTADFVDSEINNETGTPLEAKINYEGKTKKHAIEIIGSSYPTNNFDRGNLHSISPSGGPLVFVDIQSPPPPKEGSQNCNGFYFAHQKQNNGLLKLKVLQDNQLPFYSTDYTGPPIKTNF